MKDIFRYEGEYAITTDGRVWSHKTKKFLKLRGSGKYGIGRKLKRKYKTIALWTKGKGYVYFYIHRLVAGTYIPNPDNLSTVNHLDFDPTNNDVSNLEWCSNVDNLRHSFLNGRNTKGRENPTTKLMPEQVLEIRKRYARGGVSHQTLGKLYCVTPSNIYMIVNRRTWKYL